MNEEFANRAITGCLLLEFVVKEAQRNTETTVDRSTLEHILQIVDGDNNEQLI